MERVKLPVITMSELVDFFEDYDDLSNLEVKKEYVFDGYIVHVRNTDENIIVKSFLDLSEDEADEVVSHLTSRGVRTPGGVRKGDLVEDVRDENEVELVVIEESGRADGVLVGDETVAEYTGCDGLEPTYECAKVTGWANLDEKSGKERLALVEKFEPQSYHYPESLLDVVSRSSVIAGDDA